MEMDDKLKLGALAAWKAGIEILRIYITDFAVGYKEDTSPVTEADKRADKAIQEILKADNTSIISEETKQVSYKERKDWESYWLVDPLDGTKEFVQKNDEFTVNIAYVTQAQPQFGILYVPVSKKMYLADVPQKKVYLLSITNDIKESDFQNLDSLVQLIETPDNDVFDSIAVSRSHLDVKTQETVDKLTIDENVQLIRMGSALKYAKLVTGEIDLYFRFSPTMEWDNAAGHALCLASGLEMYQLPNKESLRYNTKDLYSPHFAAGTKQAINKLFNSL